MRVLERVAAIVVVAALYVVTGKIGFLMAIPPGNVTAVWPPSGIALAAFLLLGSRAWLGVWLGSFLVNAWFFSTVTNPLSAMALGTSASIAMGSTLQAQLGALLIRRFVGTRDLFLRSQDAFRFVGIEALSCMVAPTVGVASLCIGGFSHWADYAHTWWTWWLGDTAGVIVIAPPLLSWSRRPHLGWESRQRMEAVLLLVVLFIACLINFGVWPLVGNSDHSRPYTLIPLLIWAAFRLGQRGVALSILVVSATMIWATVRSAGPFAGATRNESLLSLQAFVAILAVTGLVLAAAVAERKQVGERFRLVVESAPSGMMMVGREGRILLVNSQAEKLFGYTREELLGQSIEMLVPERFRGDHAVFRDTFFGQPSVRPMGACRDLYALRKDGSQFPVEIGLNPIETEQGTLVLSTIMDITERKRAETRLRTAVEEKELLLQEIHHRVKNNLQIISSLLSIQSRRIEDTMALRTFQNSQSRIESIALIHEILCHTKDLSRIEFGRYVRELAQHLAATYGTTAQDVQVEINVPDVWLSVDQAMPLGLLITELLTNSLLHAFPAGRRGKIRIELDQAESGQLVLTVSDDGVGLPQQMDLQQAHSIGLQLVNKLAEQIHGTVEYHSNRGTQFKMVFCR